MKYEVVNHTFGATHTIDAAIKMHNTYNLTVPQMNFLRWTYNKLNNESIPSVNSTVKIPVLEEFYVYPEKEIIEEIIEVMDELPPTPKIIKEIKFNEDEFAGLDPTAARQKRREFARAQSNK